MAGGFNRSGEIDPGDHGKAAHHRRLAGDRKPVLVVERRPFDAHIDIAVHEIAGIEVGEGGLLAGLTLLDHDGFEFGHQTTEDRGQTTEEDR